MTILHYQKKIKYIFSERKQANAWEQTFAEDMFNRLRDSHRTKLSYKQMALIDKLYLKLKHKQSLFSNLSDTPNVDMFKQYCEQNPQPEVVNEKLDAIFN